MIGDTPYDAQAARHAGVIAIRPCRPLGAPKAFTSLSGTGLRAATVYALGQPVEDDRDYRRDSRGSKNPDASTLISIHARCQLLANALSVKGEAVEGSGK
jgi:hypothetical protein